ncbi:uncharacterized protein BP5553_09416 [Venustampulla echinocandica]|uniref:Uncharacterized protein n=1 Tax=Venustampulla echinocandica TaxID=2656787 RepID=A0A370TCQ9_9HELO|nr:uncharacterized protein BP5553_09416 [Venustampulla echinocandica]RDL32014.1 hypothetical protein BP5553_09416 [Venustampulla echinocandica]
MEAVLSNTTCSKGHTHPPWNTIGILRIEKCESHVAIHIKNERLSLTIAEGSSGRGRLEMPPSFDRESSSSSSRVSHLSDEMDRNSASARRESTSTRSHRFSQPLQGESYSPPTIQMSMHHPNSQPHTGRTAYVSNSSSDTPFIPTTDPQSLASTPLPSYSYHYPPALNAPSTPSTSSLTTIPQTQPYSAALNAAYPNPSLPKDPFRTLRHHKIHTKIAWTAIPSTEGMRILDLCKSLSVATPEGSPSGSQARTPCYNRETLFDEEWQAHMRDVHGVFLLWPHTWMRRIEVLDLEPYGGDIGEINDLIMDG